MNKLKVILISILYIAIKFVRGQAKSDQYLICWQKIWEEIFKGENSSLKRIGSLIHGLANSDKHLGSIVL